MSDYKPATFDELIYTNRSDHSPKIYTHAKYIYELSKRLEPLLPDKIKKQCFLANITDDSALFYVHSPAWAAQSRFRAREILAALHEKLGLTQIKSVRIKVLIISKDNQSVRTRPKLSARSSSLIKQLAKTIDDVGLRTSLLKLAQHGNGNG